MSKKRILFVDDEPNVINGLYRMLRKHQAEWEMHFCGNAAEALVKLAQAPFDVIVTDLKMPGMGGDQLLKQVVKDYPSTARIVLSGHADEIATAQASKVAHQFLSKPTDAETMKEAINRACKVQEIIQNDRTKARIAGCQTLPSLPTLYSELVKALESEDCGVKDVAQIIARDIAMSAKLLQLVNSSFFGLGRRVSSVEQAVSLLGSVRIRALVLSEGVFRQFSLPRPLKHFSIEELWNHSMMVGEVARQISKAEQQTGDRPDQAFTAGMLHDIGRLLLASQYTDEFETVLTLHHEQGRRMSEAEQEVLGVTHAEVGSYLLGLWGLPPRIVEAVALHHEPGAIGYDGMCALTAVHVADALIYELEPEKDPAEADGTESLDMNYLQRLGLAGRIDHWRILAAEVARKEAAPVMA